MLLGVVLGVVASIIKGQIDYQSMMLFVSIGIAMALLSGSVTMPLTFLLSEEKSILALIIAYPLSAFVFVGAALLIDNKLLACGLVTIVGVLLYAISWLISRKQIINKDMA